MTEFPKTSISQQIMRWLPSALWLLAAVLLLVSISSIYWRIHLDAPQYEYRDGLNIIIYVDRMTGEDPAFDELHELNELNHYIGMAHLDEAAKFERSIAIPAIIIFVIFLIVNVVWAPLNLARFISNAKASKFLNKWIWLLTIIPASFPAAFLGFLGYWLNYYGQNLDPTAPFSSSIHPFTPPVLGPGEIGQFTTLATVEAGWYMATGATVLILVGLAIRFLQSRQQIEKAKLAHA